MRGKSINSTVWDSCVRRSHIQRMRILWWCRVVKKMNDTSIRIIWARREKKKCTRAPVAGEIKPFTKWSFFNKMCTRKRHKTNETSKWCGNKNEKHIMIRLRAPRYSGCRPSLWRKGSFNHIECNFRWPFNRKTSTCTTERMTRTTTTTKRMSKTTTTAQRERLLCYRWNRCTSFCVHFFLHSFFFSYWISSSSANIVYAANDKCFSLVVAANSI